MKVEFLRTKQVDEIKGLISGFSSRYATDLKDFTVTTKKYGFASQQTADHLCRILRKWQACRPSRVNNNLLPLFIQLAPDFATIKSLNLRNIRHASPKENIAITRIWSALTNQICNNREMADVAASKTLLILTNGQLGPALDSNARKILGLSRIQSPEDYLTLLHSISDDINAFEKANAPILLENLVPEYWLPVSVGRAYDMAIGPREHKKEYEAEEISNLPCKQNAGEMVSFSFEDAFRILQLKGPARIISSRGTLYIVEAWEMRNGRQAIRAKLAPPSNGYIYIHADCWGKDITCQNTRTGGIYNCENNIYTWLKDYSSI